VGKRERIMERVNLRYIVSTYVNIITYPLVNLVKLLYANKIFEKKICFPKTVNGTPKQVKIMVMLPSQKSHICLFNESDKVKLLDLLKNSMPSVEIGYNYG
jgi:retron-type reverse transcriptase